MFIPQHEPGKDTLTKIPTQTRLIGVSQFKALMCNFVGIIINV